jgi:hypothetical protein
MAHPVLTDVAGVPECTLGDALLARLPKDAPAAPWELECDAVVWFHRGGRAVAEALPEALRAARALAVAGGMVRYRSSPVGGYDEVLGMVASHDAGRPWRRRFWGHVAFMAVDSERSLVGGRMNWAMPKTLATFDGGVGGVVPTTATGDGAHWRVRAAPVAVGPRLPVRARFATRQGFPGGRLGTSRLSARGRVRLALVRVEVESDGALPTWLRPGRHLGAVVEQGTLRVAVPSFD